VFLASEVEWLLALQFVEGHAVGLDGFLLLVLELVDLTDFLVDFSCFFDVQGLFIVHVGLVNRT
jgi:hypothetical protein